MISIGNRLCLRIAVVGVAAVFQCCSPVTAQDTSKKKQAEKPKSTKTDPQSKSNPESPNDNQHYIPIRKMIEGWEVDVDPKLLQKENQEVWSKTRQALANHLQRITYILPADRLKRIRQCRIWVELNNPKIKGMQYHPGRGWLLSKGLDPRLVKHVHIPQAGELYRRGNWTKHPYVILHELAHAYHDQVYGFNNKEIQELFRKAKEGKSYESVMDHRGRKVRHYGMNTPMEYFAESTEAYLGVNDFFPFVRAELKRHDPDMYELMAKVWGKIN